MVVSIRVPSMDQAHLARAIEYRGGKSFSPMSVLDMTLNNLMVKLQ